MILTIYNISSGEFLRTVDCPSEMAAVQVGEGEASIEGTVNWGKQYILNGVLTNYTLEQIIAKENKPIYSTKWSNVTFSWNDPRDLNQIKEFQWDNIKRARNDALTAPINTTYGVFDADTISQKNITDAISLMQVLETTSGPQTIDFTLYDNTVANLTTAQMIEVGLTLGSRTQQIYNSSRDLRTQLDAATNKAEVETIVWP